MQQLSFKYSLEEINLAARWLLEQTQGKSVIALHGQMGAGKTTLVKAVVELLGSNDAVSSPTFSIVNEYAAGNSGLKIYHADLYRLTDIEEVLNIGFEDYLNEDNCIIFIEWAEIATPLLPENTIHVYFEINTPDLRTISITSHYE